MSGGGGGPVVHGEGDPGVLVRSRPDALGPLPYHVQQFAGVIEGVPGLLVVGLEQFLLDDMGSWKV